jgi:hypothetical protein
MRNRKLSSMSKSSPARLIAFVITVGLLVTARAQVRTTSAADAERFSAELRRNTQLLLDAIAPGDVAVWDKLLDPSALPTRMTLSVESRRYWPSSNLWDPDWSAIST